MVEYHGWFSIRQSTDGEDESKITSIIQDITQFIDKIYLSSRILILKPINGTYVLSVAGVTNHRSEDVEDILKLVQLISRTAPGSYGLLYLWDDEDEKGRNNKFVVYKLARGKLEESSDNILSPCNPMIMN